MEANMNANFDLFISKKLLNIGIKSDTYKNSNQKCPKGKELKCAKIDGPVHNHNNPDCFANTAEQYWFYLAFENSICNDYITEKFWRTLDLKTVPVVMGGGNYLRDAPEKVFCSYTKHS